MAKLSENVTTDAVKLAEQAWKIAERYLVWAIGKSFCGVLVGLDKDAIAPGPYRGARQDRSQLTVAAGPVTRSAWTLHGVGGVKNYLKIQLLHPVNRAHIGHQVIVAEGGAAFGHKERTATSTLQFRSDVFHIPRREKLSFFNVDDAPACSCRDNEVSLTAEEGGNLEDINIPRGNLDLLRRMNVCGYRNTNLPPDLSEEFATLLDVRSAIGMD